MDGGKLRFEKLALSNTANILVNKRNNTKIFHTWQHILFSDESRFLLRFSDGRYRVYCRRGERFTDQCVYESDRIGGGSVMVWAGICHYHMVALSTKLFKEH